MDLEIVHMEVDPPRDGMGALIYIGTVDQVDMMRAVARKQLARLAPRPVARLDSRPARQGPQLPMELVEEILLEAWLSVSLFNALDRWELFSNLSFVSRGFRELALWVATRHVRVLSHCAMDVAAYRSIGQQCLALQHGPGPAHILPTDQAQHEDQDQEQLLANLYRHSTVHLDVTYAAYTSWHNRDRWLCDAISPGRPDDVYGVHVDFFASAHGVHTYPFPERRAPEYADWLARRRPSALSGWFADLRAAVPDCSTAVLQGDAVEPLGVAAYATLAESLWWWPSLESVRLEAGAVPGHASFASEVYGVASRGPLPPFPPLPGVKRVWLERCPRCTCGKELEGEGEGEGHKEECITRRVLEPFTGLQSVGIGAKVEREDDIVIPPGVEVRIEAGAEEKGEEPGFVDAWKGAAQRDRNRRPPRWVPMLNIAESDTLWQLVDPDGVRFPRPPNYIGFGFEPW